MEKNKILKEITEFIKMFAITWVVVFLFANWIARPVRVTGLSMYPTLHDRDFGFSSIIGLAIDKPALERFDIVVIHLNSRRYDNMIVKRVIGLPGELVEYRDNQLYIDGTAVAEPFLDTEYARNYYPERQMDFTNDFVIQLDEGEYFCMGDNRPESSDSRVYGPFKRDVITSKSIYLLYPFDRFLRVK